ncbi:MAG: hypothetical protein J5940_01330 [Clostridia bacterium]|nr:hypothetical protein [Clostridia bacterium]
MKRRTVEYNDNGTAKVCAMCERAAILESDEEHVLCMKKGIVAKDFACSRFSFDPLKFEPDTKVKLPPVDDEAIKAEAGEDAGGEDGEPDKAENGTDGK